MKTRKLSGFGSLGGEVFDTNLLTAGPDEIRQLGLSNYRDLVTVIRKEWVGGISRERYHEICTSWAVATGGGSYERNDTPNYLWRKYGENWWDNYKQMEPDDRVLVEEMHRIMGGVEHLVGMARITGARDEHGNTTGMFADGELEWHSNQQATTHYAPGAGLLAWSGTAGTCTEFLQTVDAYNRLSSEWQSMCDQLVAVHKWEPNVMAPGLGPVQDMILRMQMVPQDGTEVPIVTRSPGGHKGLHFPFTSIDYFKGMSREESKKIVAYLKEHVLRDEYIYSHIWQDGDMVLFDNSVTLHRRPTKDCSTRLLYRQSFNYDRLTAWVKAGNAPAPAHVAA